jgi:hypothetical protein
MLAAFDRKSDTLRLAASRVAEEIDKFLRRINKFFTRLE